MTKNINQKKSKLSLFLLPVVFVLLMGTVFISIEASTFGDKLSRIRKQENLLSESNKNLSDKLVKSSSLTFVEKKAEELGYKRPEKIFYITEKEAVAKLP